jgi:hypothetical protein
MEEITDRVRPISRKDTEMPPGPIERLSQWLVACGLFFAPIHIHLLSYLQRHDCCDPHTPRLNM